MVWGLGSSIWVAKAMGRKLNGRARRGVAKAKSIPDPQIPAFACMGPWSSGRASPLTAVWLIAVRAAQGKDGWVQGSGRGGWGPEQGRWGCCVVTGCVHRGVICREQGVEGVVGLQ